MPARRSEKKGAPRHRGVDFGASESFETVAVVVSLGLPLARARSVYDRRAALSSPTCGQRARTSRALSKSQDGRCPKVRASGCPLRGLGADGEQPAARNPCDERGRELRSPAHWRSRDVEGSGRGCLPRPRAEPGARGGPQSWLGVFRPRGSPVTPVRVCGGLWASGRSSTCRDAVVVVVGIEVVVVARAPAAAAVTVAVEHDPSPCNA